MKKSDIFEKSKKFIYRNARPLDLARWKFHFENGSPNEVLNILSMYQNNDGGFAHAIEPDNWNINSTPIGTWAATKIIKEVNLNDSAHPIIKNILRYLESGKDFSGGKWYNIVPSNNNYPHAIWWECKDGNGLPDDNPTVSLAGFALKYADKAGNLYKTASEIAVKSYNEFMNHPTDEIHTVKCFAELFNYCAEIKDFDLFDVTKFKEKIVLKVNAVICKEPEKWYTDYVCKPSDFFVKNSSIFNSVNHELADKEADMIVEHQLSDGSFPITWQWWTDYKEFEISANWWKSSFIINNILYLKAYSKL